MGVFCCVDRDKPPEPQPSDPPVDAFLTKKPRSTLRKTVLMIANDPEVLSELMEMLSRVYEVSYNDEFATLEYEDWAFDIYRVQSTDASRLAAIANQAKLVFFFFDLKDRRSLPAAHSCANTFRAQTRKDSVRYLVGYNTKYSSLASAEAADTAADLQFIYIELPFPRDSSRQLLEKMIR